MTDASREWGTPEQVKFVIGFVQATKRTGAEMCPLHVDFLLAVLERHVREPQPDRVDLPQNEAQAELMAKVGMMWLEQNAPHRLRASQPPGADER